MPKPSKTEEMFRLFGFAVFDINDNKWFFQNGQSPRRDVVARMLRSGKLISGNDGLFDGHHQTVRLSRPL